MSQSRFVDASLQDGQNKTVPVPKRFAAEHLPEDLGKLYQFCYHWKEIETSNKTHVIIKHVATLPAEIQNVNLWQ